MVAVICGNCGKILGEVKDKTSKKRTPCPACGSTAQFFYDITRTSPGASSTHTSAFLHNFKNDVNQML